MARIRGLVFTFLCAALLATGSFSFVSEAMAAQTSVEQKKAAALRSARARLQAKENAQQKAKSRAQKSASTKKATTAKATHKTISSTKKNSSVVAVKRPSTRTAVSKPTSKVSGKTRKAEATKQKATLEHQQKDLKTELSSLKQDLALKQSRAQSADDALKESEKAISKSNRSLKELSEKKAAASARLADLKNEAKIVGLQVGEAEDVVTSIGQAQFLNSMRHPWQTALTGGNPNELSRRSAVLGYLAQEQTRTIDRLENRQKNIETVAKKTEETRAELVRIESEEQRNRVALEKEKNSRSLALERLRGEIKTQQQRYEQLVKNDRELSVLISKIDKRIADAEAQEKLEEERRIAAQKARSKSSSRKSTAKSGGKVDTTRLTIAPVRGNFGALKGKLTMPVNGTIAASFGQRREGAASSLPWRGLLIRAKTGENVLATAPGTVVFSDWMRGFGNLLILDHGSNYLSVYANNESLFKSVGDTVSQGEAIASVGNSGGEESPGLYFELRYKGKPFDPARWLAR